MNIYCVYHVVLKKPKTTAKLSGKTRNKLVFFVFDEVLCEVRTYTATVSYRCST